LGVGCLIKKKEKGFGDLLGVVAQRGRSGFSFSKEIKGRTRRGSCRDERIWVGSEGKT
jgi:hypothetical protein